MPGIPARNDINFARRDNLRAVVETRVAGTLTSATGANASASAEMCQRNRKHADDADNNDQRNLTIPES